MTIKIYGMITMNDQGVTVCIPTHTGRGKLIRALLESLEDARRATNRPVEVIVVDDSGEPEYSDVARDCAAFDARHLRGPRSVGLKRNLAAEESRYEILLFIDSDCLLTSETIEEHARTLSTAPEDVAGVIGHTVMHGPMDRVWRTLEYSQLHNTCFDFAELYTQVGWGVTCNLSVRRDLFTNIGGFADDTFTLFGGEDVDFGLRVTERGYRWITSGTATVLHRREPISNFSQVLHKLFTYGRADVFLTRRHPARAKPYLNPVSLSVLGILVTLPLAPLWLPLSILVPYAAAIATAIVRRWHLRDTIYGPRVTGARVESDGHWIELARTIVGATIDLAFDAGVAWEAFWRGRPLQSFYHFVYADDASFKRRSTDRATVRDKASDGAWPTAPHPLADQATVRQEA